MPTLKDIQEQGAKEFYEKSDIRVEKGGFTYLYENRDELNLETIKDFINQQTTLAFQAGEKSKEYMVLKEIEKEKNIYHCFCNNGSCISHGYNLALSSLKEKIISNSK